MINPVTAEIIDSRQLGEQLLAARCESGGPGWPAEQAHEDRAGDRLGGRDDRTPRP